MRRVLLDGPGAVVTLVKDLGAIWAQVPAPMQASASIHTLAMMKTSFLDLVTMPSAVLRTSRRRFKESITTRLGTLA